MKRRPISRRKSKRMFKVTAMRQRKTNISRNMRGGFRV